MSKETLKEKFDRLLTQIDSLGEELPKDIFDKLTLYGEAKELAGDLWASWENKAKQAKTTKKEVINHVKVYGAFLKEDKPLTNDKSKEDTFPFVEAKEPTTDKMREAIAELIAKPYEDKENLASASAGHYKNKYESITEKINILKKKYDHIRETSRGGV